MQFCHVKAPRSVREEGVRNVHQGACKNQSSSSRTLRGLAGRFVLVSIGDVAMRPYAPSARTG